MKVIVIGSNGQLGTDLMRTLSAESSFEVTGLTHNDIEVSDVQAESKLVSLRPDVTINTAAFHKTDACEDEPKRAFEVNTLGALHVARACSVLNAVNVFQSTDFVFGGERRSPYSEEDEPNPINVYGASKVAGEKITAAYSPSHYIVRSSSLFGVAGSSGKGGNFVESILKQGHAGGEIKVVDDITMSPTYTKDLAASIVALLQKKPPFGVYHIANSGSCTWWQFASDIIRLAGLNAEVKKTSSSDYPTKARRPPMSALSSAKLAKHGIRMRDYREALSDYLIAKGHVQGHGKQGQEA